jgi:hypothetical protein
LERAWHWASTIAKENIAFDFGVFHHEPLNVFIIICGFTDRPIATINIPFISESIPDNIDLGFIKCQILGRLLAVV